MRIVIILVLIIVIIFQWIKADPVPHGSPIITGPRGAGKTRFAVLRIVRKFRSKYFWWKVRKVPFVGWLMAPKYEPRVYSNIPLRLTRKVWANVLKREHILMTEDLPKGSTVFIDEIGVMVNQYSHGDPNIISDHYIDNFYCAEIFTRFYRHFIGENEGDFVCTDQAVGDVNIQFRRRFDKALQLHHFHRFLFVLPFYKVPVEILDISEGEVQNTKNVNDVKGEKGHYFFGWLPYNRWFFIRMPWHYLNYATHCYALAYQQKRFVPTVPFDNWKDNPDGLYTNYIIELRSTDAEKAAYNARKKLISAGKLPADLLDPDPQLTPEDLPDLSPDQPSEAAEPPRRGWLQKLIASLPRPEGRKERAGKQ
ncbi:MAG: hypothetical protein IJW99_10605 [Clostridia bacterium]|nr:hypothetical protein [Clostridia bacterium]